MSDMFDLGGPLLDGVFAIEASAGTGKTYSLTGLVARHVAERALRPDQLLMVTFTRAATADMRDRTRSACRNLLLVLETDAELRSDLDVDPWMFDVLSNDESENARGAGHLRAFLAAYDEATITTIHGFCQLVLNRAGLSSPALGDATLVSDTTDTVSQVVSDVLIGPFSEHPDLFGESPTSTERSMNTATSDLKKIVKAVMGNPSTLRIPRITASDLRSDLDELDPERRWGAIVERVISNVHERRRAARTFGYDDLIHSVTEMLTSDSSERIVGALRDQYRLVLIDEFQDTDIAQWTIFDRAFVQPVADPQSTPGVAVGLVGDPKQAIYRFRGADIDAYRSAIDSIDRKVALVTNYRSNARVIEAVNHLFDGVTFGNSAISYRQVSARAGHTDEGLVGHVPVDIRLLPYCTEAGSSLATSNLRKAEKVELANGTLDKWKLNEEDAMELIYTDMVISIAELIESGDIIDASGKKNKVRPGDIAVLVRSHSHAERIRDVFTKAGIPAVRYRARSVFESPAAFEWRIFLSALASPSRVDRVRAAALSVFGRTSLSSMLSGESDGTEMEEWQRKVAEWSAEVQRVGLATVYFRLRSDRVFMNRVMGEVDGERLLTDLDHIAEVLAGSTDLDTAASAADCLHALERLTEEAGDDDEFQRRIETDAEAVHIATIHHSKGLEYPIVFLPTLMKMFPGSETPFIFSSQGQRVIDLATPVDWDWVDGEFSSRDERKAAAAADITGDLMRMLYVAVTRAEHKVVLYWTPLKSGADSSLGRLLFSPRSENRPDMDPESGVPATGVVSRSNAEMRAVLESIARRSPNIALVDVAKNAVLPQKRAPIGGSSGEVAAATFTRTSPVRRPGWGKWSYSGIANALGTVHAAMADPFVPGADEGRGRPSAAGLPSNGTPGILFPDDLYGAAFGNQIHKIFEAVDLTSPVLDADIRREVGLRFDRQIDAATTDRLVAAIASVCRTPLGPVFDGRELSSMSRRDRLAEMVFDMRIGSTPVPVSAVGRLLSEHLDPKDPFAEYGSNLMQRADRLRMSGYLYGEVDAVLRVARPDGSWTAVICDYKTNLLHRPGTADPLDAYRRDNLATVMADDHYVLQALFYQVALHRYLRWRVADYQPDVHLGGIAYMFVRGLVGAGTPADATGDPAGLFTWKPPVSLLHALDTELRP